MKKSTKPLTLLNLQITESENKAFVSGTLIEGSGSGIDSETRTFSVLKKIIKSYFGKPYADKPIELRSGSQKIKTQTNRKGFFSAEVPPEFILSVQIHIPGYVENIPVNQKYPAIFPKKKADYLLISDIDDTILISKSARFFSKLRLMLFKTPQKRKPVTETRKAYQMLNTKNLNFAYVSGSETNLFDLLTTFIRLNEFPEGPVFLRPYMNWRNLLKPKNRENYKLNRIERLIRYFPHQKLILFGDDSQQDYDVFTQTAEKYPQKVRAVFLRRTGLTKRFDHLKLSSPMEHSEAQLYYYDSFEQIKPILEKIATRNMSDSV